MTIKLKKWDVTEHLQTEADITDYLAACEEEGDPVLMESALLHATRASAARKYEADDGPLSEDAKRSLANRALSQMPLGTLISKKSLLDE